MSSAGRRRNTLCISVVSGRACEAWERQQAQTLAYTHDAERSSIERRARGFLTGVGVRAGGQNRPPPSAGVYNKLLLDAYCWPLTTGLLLLAASYGPLVTSGPPAAGRALLAACCRLPTTGRLPLTPYYRPPTVGRLLLAAPPTTGSVLAAYWPPPGRPLLVLVAPYDWPSAALRPTVVRQHGKELYSTRLRCIVAPPGRRPESMSQFTGRRVAHRSSLVLGECGFPRDRLAPASSSVAH